MSYKDPKDSQQPREQTRQPAQTTGPSLAPGKRTLTSRLPPGPAGAQPPVQQKPDPAAAAARSERAELTARWIDTAIRPDLYPPPVQRKRAGTESDTTTSSQVGGSGQAMPENVQAKMEHAFGSDFSGVRIHEGPQATAMGALAYTQGTDIHFAPGQYAPGSQRGQELLGHELTHVVQQSQGRVQATTQAKGVGINDDPGLEQEADEMGARTARGKAAAPGASIERHTVAASGLALALQRKPLENTGQEYDAGTGGGHDKDAPADEDGLSPRARVILQRLRMQPNLPPDAMSRLSQGLEHVADIVANYPDGESVGEQLSFHIIEDNWQLALLIAVDPRTGAIRLDLGFKDGEAYEFIGSFSISPPRLALEEEAAPSHPESLHRDTDGPELSGSESLPGPTPMEVARFLFAGSAPDKVHLLPQGVGGLASPEPDNTGDAKLEAELKQIEAEIATRERELLILAADMAIDLAGIVDPTPTSDGIAMARDLSRGDYFGAALSGISMIPWLGDAVAKPIKGVRIADKINDVRTLLTKLYKRASSLRKAMKKPGGPVLNAVKGPEIRDIKVPDINTPKLGDDTVPVTGSTPPPANKATDASKSVVRGIERPSVTNPKLDNLVRDLYKGANTKNPIGTGSTADAIRHEAATGQAVGGRFHTQKGQEYARALERWLTKNPDASAADRTAAQSMLDDLRSALEGK